MLSTLCPISFAPVAEFRTSRYLTTCPCIDKLSRSCPCSCRVCNDLLRASNCLQAQCMRRPRHANLFIAAMLVLGVAEFLTVAADWQSSSLRKFFCYLLITVAGSLLKVKLPGVTSTMSLNFLFVLVAITELSVPEALFIGCIATLIQSF